MRGAVLILGKAWAFLKRDFRIATSYRLSFLLTSVYSLFILTLIFFVGKMIGPNVPGLDMYRGGYFVFALVGYAFYQYFQLALTGFSNSIQREQVTGCLEAMVATRTSPEVSILLSALYSLITNLVQLIGIFVVGAIVFGAELAGMNVLATLLAFVLAICVYVGFGIFSASFIVVLKKGDPITWLLTTVSFVFGGAFFPVEQMPHWMQAVSRFVPATYALNTLRSSIINGSGVRELGIPLAVLAAIAIVVMPVSLFVLRLSVRKAKREGTLVLY